MQGCVFMWRCLLHGCRRRARAARLALEPEHARVIVGTQVSSALRNILDSSGKVAELATRTVSCTCSWTLFLHLEESKHCCVSQFAAVLTPLPVARTEGGSSFSFFCLYAAALGDLKQRTHES